MPQVLRFGISSLDELLGTHPILARKTVARCETFTDPPFGIYLPTKEEILTQAGADGADKEDFTTSLCIIGPNGAGKSIFGLHMASTYLADCEAGGEELPAVLYISTDFTFNMAQRVWGDFALDRPFSRKDPFGPTRTLPAAKHDLKINLKPCKPTDLAEKFDMLEKDRSGVVFVDIASYTAGDDWGFVHKLLSLLSKPGDDKPRHLVVLDAIEGFEALAGDLNAFGEKSTRRSRVAQVMRLIAGKCHVLLVVEEGKKHERLAEEFVADTVIKLENLSTRNYERRVIKVEKVRGQSHIRGHHHYSIRSGYGSTTGLQINPDDPEVPAPSSENDDTPKQSYIQTFHSVHRLSRKIMEMRGRARKELEANAYYAAFGIKYLDNMLGGKDETTERIPRIIGGEIYPCDTRGLPCSSTTALIGDSLTQKSTLGRAFLSRCFHSFDTRLSDLRQSLNKAGEQAEAEKIWKHVSRKVELLSDSPQGVNGSWEEKGKELVKSARWEDLLEHVADKVDDARLPFPLKCSTERQWACLFDAAELSDLSSVKSPTDLLHEARLTHLAAWLLDYQAGVAVMLATQNTHYEKLAKEFIGWLHTERELKDLNATMKGYKKALENYIKGGTVCRRLEIHSMSSEILIHIVQQVTNAAQRKILTPTDMRSLATRYEKSWPIRVVIDDFSTFRDIFPELREDPLLLPSLLFYFEREGVTTLIIDTQSGKPETPIAERFESELRQMVQHNLYTWRVPFYGESRVAITAIPPLSYEYAGIVRELRWESETLNQPHTSATLNEQYASVVSDPPTVDPHFELYTGLEEGKPQPVPLHVRFYAETPAIEAYIAMENSFLNERFIPHASIAQTGDPSVIVGVPAANYDELRDFAYLQRDTRLDHTLVFQVDEFWAMRPPPGRRKRAGSFQPQWAYLNAITAEAPAAGEDYKPDPNIDVYKLFQWRESDPPRKEHKSLELRRQHFYEKYYDDFSDYEELANNQRRDEYLIDRVPFSWDFGFLLCQEKAWEDNERSFEVRLPDEASERWTVSKVWEALKKAKDKPTVKRKAEQETDDEENRQEAERSKHVSWRVFTEACKKVAERQSDKLSKPVTAFDFAQISPESFSCLILEMWFSEIYESLQRQKGADATADQKSEAETALKELLEVSKRQLFVPAYDSRSKSALTLSDLLSKYWLELYKCWMLLIEVINFSDIVGDATALNFDFRSKNTDFSAVASRHWYKTATQCPDEVAGKETLVAVRLPGHFSVRGDWFLAVSGSSRSIRQAERALDLLNSRRANVTRLQLGIGLPARSPKDKSGADSAGQKSSLGMLRTKLISHEGGQDTVEYETFLKIAAQRNVADERNASGENDFHWLWRSSLRDYAHYNRIWHKWLYRTLLWWHRKLLRYKSAWINSFMIYDNLTIEPFATREAFVPSMSEIDEHRAAENPVRQEFLTKYRVQSLAQLIVRSNFLKLVEVLEEELKQACEANYNSEQD